MSEVCSDSFEKLAEPRPPITIGVASPADTEALIAHMEVVYADTYPNDDDLTRDMFEGNEAFRNGMRDYLEQQLMDPAHTLFVAKSGDRIVGTIGLAPSPTNPLESKIWGFYVDPDNQGQGIGRQLWASLMGEVGNSESELLTLDVAKDSESAVNFYLRSGFRIVGEASWTMSFWTERQPVSPLWRMSLALR